MAVINTNITALIGQQNLTRSQSALQTSMERLSSGLRINSAADDAAGQAIANRMTAQISGLAQAQRNANDGISVSQTAEGALNQINDNLQRIRTLTVQAQNGTNSGSDLSSIQDEINERLAEINRVSEQTSFNGVNVLAKDQTLSIQVGANDGQTIDIQLKKIDANTLGLGGFSVAQNTLSVTDAISQVPGASASSATIAVDLSSAAAALGVDAGGLTLHAIKNSSGAATNQYVVQSGGDFYAASFDGSGKVTLNTTTVHFTDPANGVSSSVSLTGQLVHVGVNASGGVTAFANVQGYNYAVASGALELNGSATSTTIVLSGSTATPTFTGASTSDPLKALDAALSQVDDLRSNLGAMQNRFESAIENLGTTTTNLSAARSRIQDADYAVEVSNMTRAQILQQAGTSVLAQANQVPQTVLQLLR